MSAKGESVRRQSLPEVEREETPPASWSTNDESLAEQTQRVIDEAKERISRSIRKEFEPAE